MYLCDRCRALGNQLLQRVEAALRSAGLGHREPATTGKGKAKRSPVASPK